MNALHFLLATAFAQEPAMWSAHSDFVQSQNFTEDVVIFISIEDYLYVTDYRGSKQNAEDWKRWLTQSQGISSDRMFVLEDAQANKKSIAKVWKDATKMLGKKGRMWLFFFGYGSSQKGKPFLVLADTTLKKNDSYKKGWFWSDIHKWLKKNKDVEMFAVLDACFSGSTPYGEKLNIPTEAPDPKSFTHERLSVLLPNSTNSCQGEIPRLRRLPFSYFALGALKGWGDIDFDGEVSIKEMLGYVQKVYDKVAPTRSRNEVFLSGAPERIRSKAVEEGPDLEEINWILFPKKKEKRGAKHLPWETIENTGDFDDLLANLDDRRKMEYTFETERSEKAAAVREKAERHWNKVEEFIDQAVDDYAKMATYAFLDTYKSARVQVQQQDLGIQINQVEEAEKLILGMEIPKIQDKGASFVWIPNGSFMMGSPLSEENRFEEERQHPVRISRSFYISSTEITQELYQSVMNENPSALVDANLPVNQVSWYDTLRFANRLSLKEGLETCYVINGNNVEWPKGPTCEGYRLPTEAEWEYAARGNTPSVYSGGNKLDVVAWYEANSSSQIQPVASKEANAFGLYDMSGNVWEWVWDGYGAYPAEEEIDPVGEDLSSYRIRRGGSVGHLARYARNAYRARVTPKFQSNELGFRVVRTASLPEVKLEKEKTEERQEDQKSEATENLDSPNPSSP